MESFRERALVFLCQNRILVLIISIFSFIGVLFTLLSIAFLDRTGGPFIVAVLNLVGLLVLLGWSGYVSWKCYDRISDPTE